MIKDKRMKLVKQQDGLDFYLYTPSAAHMYFDDGKPEQWPVHQKTLSHKLHMSVYLLHGGYNILYMAKDDNIISYIVFSRGGDVVIRSTTKEDIYTIFVWTYPEFRKQGYGARIVRELLHGIGLQYKTSYKTIYADNTGSIKAAFANGYRRVYPVRRTKLLHTAYRAPEVKDYHLYAYESGGQQAAAG